MSSRRAVLRSRRSERVEREDASGVLTERRMAEMAQVQGLRCRECGKDYDVAPIYTCEWCFGPLEVAYDYDAITAEISRESIAAGPASIWRYAPLLPVEEPGGGVPNVGLTPLARADRLAAELGLGEVWVKDDTRNPTNSFKDRVVAVALAKALEFGLKTIACASTGNLANAVAAHSARAGVPSYVFVPADLEPGKIVTTAVYGGTLVAIDGTYDDVNRLCAELADSRPWAFVNVNVRPFYAEGSRTLAFETAEQLGWQAPDHVVVPVASGSLLTKIHKGFDELHRVGLLDREPTVRISGAQSAGCAPIATAFTEGSDAIRPVRPNTIAKSLAIGNPADGYYALDTVRSTGGAFAAVTDDGVARPVERVVVYVTGHGLKTLDAVAPQAGPTATIAPTLEAFDEALGPSSTTEPSGATPVTQERAWL